MPNVTHNCYTKGRENPSNEHLSSFLMGEIFTCTTHQRFYKSSTILDYFLYVSYKNRTLHLFFWVIYPKNLRVRKFLQRIWVSHYT